MSLNLLILVFASINCESCLEDALAPSFLCAALVPPIPTRWLCTANYCSKPLRFASLRCKCNLSKETDWCYTLLTTSKQTCISNMLGQAVALGCPSSTDVTCICSTVDFANGVRDCANEACANGANANEVISFAIQYCASGECRSGSRFDPLTMVSRRERQWIRFYHW